VLPGGVHLGEIREGFGEPSVMRAIKDREGKRSFWIPGRI
jgi:hypothetical protein